MRPSCEESLQDTATTKWYLRCHHIGGNEDSTLVVYTAHNLLVGHSEGLCCHANQGEQTKSINYSAFHGYTSRSSEWHRSTSGNKSAQFWIAHPLAAGLSSGKSTKVIIQR